MILTYKSRVGVVALAIALLIALVFYSRAPDEAGRQAGAFPLAAADNGENEPDVGGTMGRAPLAVAGQPVDDAGSSTNPAGCDPSVLADDSVGPAYPWDENPPDILAIADIMAKSDDPQHMIVGALLTGGEENFPTRGERLKAALAANPKNAVFLSIAYFQCERGQPKNWCDADEVESALIEADSHSADTWANIAGRRARNGDFNGALVAIQRAATAPALNTFYIDHYEMMSRGFAAAGVSDHVTRIYLALAYGFAVRVPYTGLFVACREHSAIDDRWHQACQAFGERLDLEAKTEIGRAFGLAIQEAALTENDSAERKEIVVAKRARREAIRKERLASMDAAVAFDRELWSNDMLVDAYAKELVHGDEFSAQALLEAHRAAWEESRCKQVQ